MPSFICTTKSGHNYKVDAPDLETLLSKVEIHLGLNEPYSEWINARDEFNELVMLRKLDVESIRKECLKV